MIDLSPSAQGPGLGALGRSAVLTRIGLAFIAVSCLAMGQPGQKQRAMTRRVSEVEATGRAVRLRLGNRELAAAGLLDVTAAPYHADNTGLHDATAALRKAIMDAREARLIAYLPVGRYLVSGTIEGVQGVVEWDYWPHEGFADPWVSIVLADRALGFGDPIRPKPVLHFWVRAYDPKRAGGSEGQPARAGC